MEDSGIKSSKSRYRIGDEIDSQQVLLITEDGTNEGIKDLQYALDYANQVGLDLVEIGPNSTPPTCKVLDYGRVAFSKQKKSKQKVKRKQLKELKFRPNIDVGDYQVKLRNIIKFIEGGDKVKITIRFRGREMAHQDLGMKVIERIKEDTLEIANVDQEAKMDGRQIIMMLSPKKK